MEKEQLAQIIAAYGTDILRFCRITAGSKAEGDELYQDTMLILLEKRSDLDGAQNVKGYAISVAVKLWKNKQRKVARRLRLVPQESLEALTQRGIQPEQTPSPEEDLLQKSQAEALREMIRQLPQRYRLPLQLHYSAEAAGEGNRKADETAGKHGKDQAAPGQRTIAAETGGNGL